MIAICVGCCDSTPANDRMCRTFGNTCKISAIPTSKATVVAGSDRTISPDLARWRAKRARSHTVDVAGASHSVYVSHPKEVADVIESAARAASK